MDREDRLREAARAAYRSRDFLRGDRLMALHGMAGFLRNRKQLPCRQQAEFVWLRYMIQSRASKLNLYERRSRETADMWWKLLWIGVGDNLPHQGWKMFQNDPKMQVLRPLVERYRDALAKFDQAHTARR